MADVLLTDLLMAMGTNKENCLEAVYQYLTNQNRPYGINDILQNLHNEYAKSAIQRALDELSTKNKIREKVYGKQKVYCCKQETEDDSNDCEFKPGVLDDKIEEATVKMKNLEQQVNMAEAELKTLQNEPTTENAAQQIVELEKTVAVLRERANDLTEPLVTITEDEKIQLKTTCDKFYREYKKRKNMCMDIIHSILENYPKKMKYLLEDIGIEVDEED